MRPLMKEEQQRARRPHTKPLLTRWPLHIIISRLISLPVQSGVYSGCLQEDVFEMVGVPLAENCVAEFNSSIFAYGQTKSGKIYTMWGPSNASNEDKIQSKHKGITRVFERSFAQIHEIYNGQITDLLGPS